VTEFFLIRLPGNPTDLKVVTVADGPDAEMMRKEFSTDGRAAFQNQEFERFAARYPISRGGPHGLSGHEEQNEVRDNRVLADRPDVVSGAAVSDWSGRFYPHNIEWAARKPAVSFRSMPLGQVYPKNEVFALKSLPR